MKLIRLSCDQDSFRTINFNPEGVTIILGRKNPDEISDGSLKSSVNGVGKTQALHLVNFCLGASNKNEISTLLNHAVPDWVFKLEFSVNDCEHFIERSGDSKNLLLDEKKVSLAALQSWLDSSGIFPKVNDFKYISFRSLFSRFARPHKKDSIDALSLGSETTYTSLINNAYLMHVDLSLIERKHQLKQKLEANKSTRKLLNQDSYLKDSLKSTPNSTLRKKELEKTVLQMTEDLNNFTISDDYYEIEKEAEELKLIGRDLQRNISALQFKVSNIDKSLENNPDIDVTQLMHLYEGLENIFKSETLAHFEKVHRFHIELTTNRVARLRKEKINIQNQIININEELKQVVSKRDAVFSLLKDTHALDEYLSVTNQLSSYKEELAYLKKYITMDEDIKKQNLDIKKKLIDVVASALEYVQSDPLNYLHSKFQEITNEIYPHLNSGIFIELIESDNNMLTYKLFVELDTDGSDGVASSKILAYDWLIYKYGYHNMQMLWHDNRLFADTDPEELARWFEFVSKDLENTNRQYITSININNYEDMTEFLSDEVIDYLNRSIAITLRGDKKSNKLLGINFDKHRKTS